jgi:hypothetical protein
MTAIITEPSTTPTHLPACDTQAHHELGLDPADRFCVSRVLTAGDLGAWADYSAATASITIDGPRHGTHVSIEAFEQFCRQGLALVAELRPVPAQRPAEAYVAARGALQALAKRLAQVRGRRHDDAGSAALFFVLVALAGVLAVAGSLTALTGAAVGLAVMGAVPAVVVAAVVHVCASDAAANRARARQAAEAVAAQPVEDARPAVDVLSSEAGSATAVGGTR